MREKYYSLVWYILIHVILLKSLSVSKIFEKLKNQLTPSEIKMLEEKKKKKNMRSVSDATRPQENNWVLFIYVREATRDNFA